MTTVRGAARMPGATNENFMTANEIRRKFLDFFKGKGHRIVPSAPVVVKNDPTLMFTNAGMNQFKDYFLGNKPAPYPRVADTQKCLRVSGKHNDLEEVGVDTYHHTFFEMLGNWSFGDYFKKEAIAWSWELLTKEFRIPEDRLYVTVFEGDEKEGLEKDKEAATEWKKWIAEDRILPGNKKDNFWEMGDTGPCGPCTEIHVDTRPDEERKKVDGKTLVNADNPQVIEIWNNVFIQFNRLKDGSLQPLPAKHVDTGMGFERLVCVLQGQQSNYDTDVFDDTIKKVEEITNKKYRRADSKSDIAFRVLADHIRAIAFTIADGQLPSNTGAGYVIRRILRRAVRYYYSYLNYQQPLLFQLAPVIARQFQEVFPELYQQEQFVTKVVREEEEAFLRTIDVGLKRFNIYTQSGHGFVMENIEDPEEDAKITRSYVSLQTKYEGPRRKKIVHGEFAFELNDTYGFPIDLTELMAKEQGWTVDIEGFNAEMQKQKERSRAATTLDTEDWVIVNEQKTNSQFVGYDSLETKANVLRYRKIKAKGKESYQIVLDKTPFYAESGGQVGDTGKLIFDGEEIEVTDTKKENDLIVHFTQKLPQKLTGEVEAKVDADKRRKTALHHSATHLVHAALRKVLGQHVTQKGSLVNADYLRFDFSHFSKLTTEEISEVEKLVNEKIRQNIPVVIKQMPREEALQMGAMALFGEKYGDTVRVVIIAPSYSVELCGGTHVGDTGELGLFKIISEGAVAAGVRRIEAVCGEAAEQYINVQLQQLQQIKEILKYPKDVLKGIEKLMYDKAEAEKRLEQIELTKSEELINEVLNKNVKQIKDVFLVVGTIKVYSTDILRKVVFGIKNKLHDVIVVMGANVEDKSYFQILFNPKPSSVLDLNMNAQDIVKQIEPFMKERHFGGNKKMVQGFAVFTKNFETVINELGRNTEARIKSLYQLDDFLDSLEDTNL